MAGELSERKGNEDSSKGCIVGLGWGQEWCPSGVSPGTSDVFSIHQ